MATQAARKQRRLKAFPGVRPYVLDRSHPGPGRHPLAMPLYHGRIIAPAPTLTPDQYVRLRNREIARQKRRAERGPTKRQRKLDAYRAAEQAAT